MRLLHHPEAARPLPQPAGRVDRRRGARARRARRQGTAADLAGHDVLRHRPPRARRAGPAAARAERGRRHRVDPPALPLPDDDHRRDDRGDGRPATRSCKYIDLPLQHASDARPEADEAAGHARQLRAAARRASASALPERRAAHHVHRRLPRRDRGRLRRARARSSRRSSSTTSASSPTRTRRAPPPMPWPTTCRPGPRTRRQRS